MADSDIRRERSKFRKLVWDITDPSGAAAGEVLTADGLGGASYQPSGGGGGTPGGADTNIQYNDGGAFGGDGGFTFDDSNRVVTLDGSQARIVIDETDGGGDSRLQLTSTTTADGGAAVLFDSTTGRLALQQTDDFGNLEDLWINMQRNGGVSIYHNNSPIISTFTNGISVRAGPSANTGIFMQDTGGATDAAIIVDNGGPLIIDNRQNLQRIDLQGRDSLSATVDFIVMTPEADVALFHDDVEVARTLAAASGGFEVNNTLTGAGFERVLTASDLPSGGSIVNGTVNNQAARWDDANSQWEASAYVAFGESRDKSLLIGIPVAEGFVKWVGDITTQNDERAYIGFPGTTLEMEWKNLTNASRVTIRGTDGITERTFLNASPNADTLLRGTTGLRLESLSGVIEMEPGGNGYFTFNNAGILDLLGNGTQSGILRFTEGVSEFSSVAGQAQLWVRDDDPNRLIFTDDDDTQNVLAYVSELGVSVPSGSFTGALLYWDGAAWVDTNNDLTYSASANTPRLTVNAGFPLEIDAAFTKFDAFIQINPGNFGNFGTSLGYIGNGFQIATVAGNPPNTENIILLPNNGNDDVLVNQSTTGGNERVLTTSDFNGVSPSKIGGVANSADSATSDIALSDDVDLNGFVLEQGKTYRFEGMVFFQTNGDGGARWDFQLSGAGGLVFAQYSWQAMATDGPRVDEPAEDVTGMLVTSAITITAGERIGVLMRGTVQVNNAGDATLDFRFAQLTSDASALNREIGSYIVFEELQTL